jgi:hypothetical protein
MYLIETVPYCSLRRFCLILHQSGSNIRLQIFYHQVVQILKTREDLAWLFDFEFVCHFYQQIKYMTCRAFLKEVAKQ